MLFAYITCSVKCKVWKSDIRHRFWSFTNEEWNWLNPSAFMLCIFVLYTSFTNSSESEIKLLLLQCTHIIIVFCTTWDICHKLNLPSLLQLILSFYKHFINSTTYLLYAGWSFTSLLCQMAWKPSQSMMKTTASLSTPTRHLSGLKRQSRSTTLTKPTLQYGLR